jgi:hypothetical protein
MRAEWIVSRASAMDSVAANDPREVLPPACTTHRDFRGRSAFFPPCRCWKIAMGTYASCCYVVQTAAQHARARID